MNEIIMNAVTKPNASMHDLFKSLAQAFIAEKLTVEELIPYLAEDYRLLSLFNTKQFTLEQKKAFIDSNIETFYELYQDLDYELFDYVLSLESTDVNIRRTMINIIRKDENTDRSFDYVFENVTKIDDIWGITNFIETYPCQFTKSQIETIINYNGIKSAEFIETYTGELIPYDELSSLSKSVVDVLNNDNEYFYELIEKLAKNFGGGDFIHIAEDMSLKLEYSKVLNLIKKLIDDNQSDYDCVKLLVRICIANNWLQVFNDTEIDYMNFSYTLYSSKLDLKMINNYDPKALSIQILKHITYAGWKEVKPYISFYEYVMIKIRGDK